VKTKRMWGLSLVMALTMVLAGCGGGASKAPEKSPQAADKVTADPAPAAPATKEKMTARIAPGPKGGVLYVSEMLAEGIGAFTEQGVDVSVLDTTGGNEAAKALMSGEAEFALLAYDHVLKNRAQGADLVVVSFLTKNPGLIMVVQPSLKDKVKSITDLKGTKVAVSSLGGGTHMTVLSLMNKAGMQPTDIEFIAAKDKLGEMWDQQQVAAAMHVDPQITDLVGNNKAWILYDFRKDADTRALYGSEYPLGTLVTRQDIIQKNPELVQRVVNAVQTANKYVQSHTPAEVAAKVPAQYKGGSTLYEQMVTENVPGLSLTGVVSMEGMQTVLKELQDKKVIPADAKVDVPSSINMSFVQKAPK
jgi:NitT/TauT family transport system substrate-binding protein